MFSQGWSPTRCEKLEIPFKKRDWRHWGHPKMIGHVEEPGVNVYITRMWGHHYQGWNLLLPQMPVNVPNIADYYYMLCRWNVARWGCQHDLAVPSLSSLHALAEERA